jgi:hypothetical protein
MHQAKSAEAPEWAPSFGTKAPATLGVPYGFNITPVANFVQDTITSIQKLVVWQAMINLSLVSQRGVRR